MHLRGGLPLFSSAHAGEAKNASFALMSDVFMRGLQCHPPWGSCEVAAHVCGAIYSMMKWGDLCLFHIHLPFTHTYVHAHTVWACVPPTSTVLWLYVTANTSVHLNLQLCDHSDKGSLGDYARLCHTDLLTADGPTAWRLLSCVSLNLTSTPK